MSLTVKVPVRAPVAVGVKITLIAQALPAVTELPQLLVWAKSPLMEILEMLSVVVPVHNEAAHIPATIDALAQAVARSGFDAELVLVDDGSTDGSAAFLRPRKGLRKFRTKGLGVTNARNFGARQARGEALLFADAHIQERVAQQIYVQREEKSA